MNDVYHINGDVSDNIPENFDWKPRGVTFNKRLKKWIAQIMINKEHKYLGAFASKREAGEANIRKHMREVKMKHNVKKNDMFFVFETEKRKIINLSNKENNLKY